MSIAVRHYTISFYRVYWRHLMAISGDFYCHYRSSYQGNFLAVTDSMSGSGKTLLSY